jgi:tRNA threonylcarbamoyladenosine biosynthesis protein TsaB
MIDARRMEVFTALFDHQLNYIQSPANLVLNEFFFQEFLKDRTICFFGDGSFKFQGLIKHSNAMFKTFEISALLMISLTYQKFIKQDFVNLAYSQPFYGKDFYSSAKLSL